MMDFKKAFIPGNCLEKKNETTLRVWKNFVSDARLPNEHFQNIQNLSQPRLRHHLDQIDERASSKIFQSLIEDRSYDAFGRYKVCDKLESSSRDVMVQNASKKDLISLAARARLDLDNDILYNNYDKLSTPSWKIGTKSLKHAPPGLSPPLQNIPNSEGNEKFFSYDGEWRDGNLEGEGTYKYHDCSTYEGIFKRNFPNGHGKSTYPGGTVYVGEWKDGYPNGKGKAIYQHPRGLGSIIYDGEWNTGRRHGEGTLTYINGSNYKGGFKRGRFHGRGTFTSKDSGLVYMGTFQRGYVSGRCIMVLPDGRRITKEWPDHLKTKMNLFDAIKYIENTEIERKKAKQEEKDRLFGPVRAENLRRYVENVRQSIEEKNKMEKEKQIEHRRKLIRDAIANHRSQRKSEEKGL